jgi:hypothetical protein
MRDQRLRKVFVGRLARERCLSRVPADEALEPFGHRPKDLQQVSQPLLGPLAFLEKRLAASHGVALDVRCLELGGFADFTSLIFRIGDDRGSLGLGRLSPSLGIDIRRSPRLLRVGLRLGANSLRLLGRRLLEPIGRLISRAEDRRHVFTELVVDRWIAAPRPLKRRTARAGVLLARVVLSFLWRTIRLRACGLGAGAHGVRQKPVDRQLVARDRRALLVVGAGTAESAEVAHQSTSFGSSRDWDSTVRGAAAKYKAPQGSSVAWNIRKGLRRRHAGVAKREQNGEDPDHAYGDAEQEPR